MAISETSQALYKRAYDAHYKESDYDKALLNYNLVIEHFPDSAEANYARTQLENLNSSKDKLLKQRVKSDVAPKCKTEAEIAGDGALAAKTAGSKLYQIVLPLSTTRGGVVPMMTVFTTSETADHASILEAVEEHGWHLEHVNYVFRMTETVSRDKFLSSGQQEAVSGEVLGIYIFRLRADNVLSEK